jgi:hypothetical protein
MSKFSKIFYRLGSLVTFASKAGTFIGPAYDAFKLLLPGDPNAVPPVKLH